MKRVGKLLKCIIALVDMYRRSLLSSHDTFIHNVGTTELISHARPTSDFHFLSKQGRDSRVITQPYVIGEYGRWGVSLVQLGRIRTIVGTPGR